MQTQVSIKRILFRNVAGFLVYTNKAVILVDTGHRGMNDHIMDALKEIGCNPGDLNLIVLTHTHYDHAGGASALKVVSGAPVVVNEREAENLRRGRTTIPAGTRWKGKLISFLGRILARRVMKLDPLEADVLVANRMDLHEFGIPGYILHTPGHTAGSQSVILENGIALVGDNFLGFQGNDHFPPFADSMDDVLESWQKLIDSGCRELMPAHGDSIAIEEIRNELSAAISRYGSKELIQKKRIQQ